MQAFTTRYLLGDAHWTSDSYLAPHPGHGGGLVMAEVIFARAPPPGESEGYGRPSKAPAALAASMYSPDDRHAQWSSTGHHEPT